MTSYTPISIEKELELAQSLPHPYIFEQENKLFIGLNHTRNFSHPQFKIIFEKIKRFNPLSVFLEIPNSLIQTLIDSELNEGISKFGEIGIIYSKLPPGINFVGWDLEKDKLKQMLRTEFDNDLLEAFYVLHSVQAKVSRFNQEPILFLKEELKDKPNTKQIIESYFKKRLNKPLDELRLSDRISPSPLEESIFLDIKRKEAELRDLNLINLITNSKGKLLILGGRNHIIRIVNSEWGVK